MITHKQIKKELKQAIESSEKTQSYIAEKLGLNQIIPNPNSISMINFGLYCVKALAKPTKAYLRALPCLISKFIY